MSNILVLKNKTLAKVAGSTNFTVQSLMLLLYAILEFLGFPMDVVPEIEEFVKATLLAGVGFWGVIRSWFLAGLKPQLTGNVITYLLAFIGGFVGWIGSYAGEIQGAFMQLIETISSGNINLLFPAVFALLNIVFRIFRDKPWLEDSQA